MPRGRIRCPAAAPRRAPPRAPEERRERTRGPAPPGPPSRPPTSATLPGPAYAPGLGPSAVTCCRGRLPPHSTPGSAGGLARGSHMRPRALRSRRRGAPRSTRIRSAGPGAGANAAPPLRLWLPREKPPFSVPRRPRPSPRSLVAARETPSASRSHRVGPLRRGPDTESKMAPALAAARFPRRVSAGGGRARLRRGRRARLRRGAFAEGEAGGGRRPRPCGSARRPARPRTSVTWFRLECLPVSSRIRDCGFSGFFVLKPKVGGLEPARCLTDSLLWKLEV